jgi:hypothetical protein
MFVASFRVDLKMEVERSSEIFASTYKKTLPHDSEDPQK